MIPAPSAIAGPPADDDVDLGSLNGFIGFRLRRIQNHLSRQFAEQTQQFALPSGGLSALAIIDANPGISQAAVAREIGMDASAAVALLDELCKRAWAERRRADKDRRRYAIHLTAEGRRILDQLLGILSRTEDKALHALSSRELLTLNKALDTIYKSCFRGSGGP